MYINHRVINSKDQKSIEGQHQEASITKEAAQDLEMSLSFFQSKCRFSTPTVMRELTLTNHQLFRAGLIKQTLVEPLW